MRRRVCGLALPTVAALALALCGAAQPTPADLVSEVRWVSSSELARRLVPGPGISVSLADTPAEQVATELRVSGTRPWTPEAGREVTLDHSAGLRITQALSRELREGAVLIDSAGTLANAGGVALSDLHDLRALSLGFAGPDLSARYSYSPMTHSDDQWYGSTYYVDTGWAKVGRDWQHPESEVASCRTFIAPRSGDVQVTGRVMKAHLDGDGVRLFVRHNTETVWHGEIEGADAVGLEPDLRLHVGKSDAVRFVVDKRGAIFCDTTHWDPTITYTDGEAFTASQGFGVADAPWRYESERDAMGAGGAPVLHYASPTYVWKQVALTPGTSTELRGHALEASGGAMPGFVLADPRDTGGLLIAAVDPGLWLLRAVTEEGGELRVDLVYGVAQGGVPERRVSLAPGEAIPLPRVTVGSYTGPWQTGRKVLTEHLAQVRSAGAEETRVGGRAHGDEVGLSLKTVGGGSGIVFRDGMPVARFEGGGRFLDTLGLTTAARYSAAAEVGFHLSPAADVWVSEDGDTVRRPEAALAEMVEADWAAQDALDGTAAAYLRAADDARVRSEALMAVLEQQGADVSRQRAALSRLAALREAIAEPIAVEAARAAYLAARRAKREVALANPLLGSDPMLLVKRVPTGYSHLVMQYFGWRARPGGGLFVLEQPGWSLRTRSLLPPDFASGSVLAPNLSFDADRVVFSYSSCQEPDPFFHIYEVGLDGTGLRKLSDGPFEDLMPSFLPDGGIIFCSTRRQGYARCFGAQFGERWHVYTLHRMDGDGANLRTLSFHETNEWFPTALPDGSVMYARWDYVDRHAVLHQNLWRTNPDGTNPVALYGNHTQSPHCSFEARPIPGSRKLMATASAHHSMTAGSIITIDPDVDYDGPAPIERLTPEVPFPEAEAWPSTYYAAPWPLSEDFYLAAYSPQPLLPEPQANEANALGIYLMDRWGNRELLVRDPDLGCTSPMLIRSRPRPPVIPSSLQAMSEEAGTYLLHDVSRGLGDVPGGSAKALRVIQILPKSTPVGDAPPVGLAGQEPTRMVLGTVPVEEDGSAYFTAPARKPLLFQALDEQGRAIQTMRSASYLQPGEHASCIGCHESRVTAPPQALPRAAERAPSPIAPGPDGCAPFSYVRLVQPVLDRHCTSCHSGESPAGGMDLTGAIDGQWTRSYLALTQGQRFWQDGTNPTNAAEALVPRYGGWNPVHTTAVGGAYGARGSRLIAMVEQGHRGVTLPPEDLERVVIWVDANALFYGTYQPDEQRRQLAGEVVQPPELQ